MIWGLIRLVMWFGVAFAACTIVIAAALVLILGAILVGALLPSRTVGGQLRSLIANAEAAVAQVGALRVER